MNNVEERIKKAFSEVVYRNICIKEFYEKLKSIANQLEEEVEELRIHPEYVVDTYKSPVLRIKYWLVGQFNYIEIPFK